MTIASRLTSTLLLASFAVALWGIAFGLKGLSWLSWGLAGIFRPFHGRSVSNEDYSAYEYWETQEALREAGAYQAWRRSKLDQAKGRKECGMSRGDGSDVQECPDHDEAKKADKAGRRTPYSLWSYMSVCLAAAVVALALKSGMVKIYAGT